MDAQQNIEVFDNEKEALKRITELRARGLPADNIYVFSQAPANAAKLTAETDVNYKSADGSVGDKFASLFTNTDPEEKVLDSFFDLNKEEKEKYTHDLIDGKILLCVKETDSVEQEDTGEADSNLSGSGTS